MMAAQALLPQPVQIGVAHNCLDYVLPFAYSARYQRQTGIAVGLTVGPSELTLAAVEQGSLDFVITDRVLDETRRLTTETLYENRVFVVCARSHRLASGKDLTLADLVGEPWIVCSSMTKLHLHGIFERAGLPAPRVTVRGSCSRVGEQMEGSSQLLAVRAVPTVLALAEVTAGLALLDVNDLTWTQPIFAIYRSARCLSPAASRLIGDMKALAISDLNLQ